MSNAAKNSKRLHVFRAGTHTPMSGEAMTFSAADVAELASSYDPAVLEAPLVVGHPRTDDPAYGWVGKAFANGDDLEVEPANVEPAFAEMVNAGRFRRISIALFPREHPGNPKPGSLYLKHIGFLGAQAPAVKGLRPAQFAADDAVRVIELEAPDVLHLSASTWSMARLARSLREWLIESQGVEVADRVVPSYVADDLTVEASKPTEAASVGFAAPTHPGAAAMNPNTLTAEQLEAERAKLETERKALAADRRKLRQTTQLAFCDGLVAAGRLQPGHRAAVAEVLVELESLPAVTFAEGTETRTSSPLEVIRAALEGAKPAIEFGEHGNAAGPRSEGPGDQGQEVAAFAAPTGTHANPSTLALDRRIRAHMARHACDYATAARAVGVN